MSEQDQMQKSLAAATTAGLRAAAAAATWSAKTIEAGSAGSSSFSLFTAGVALCGVGLMLNAYAAMARR